jgi:hypothetical protein
MLHRERAIRVPQASKEGALVEQQRWSGFSGERAAEILLMCELETKNQERYETGYWSRRPKITWRQLTGFRSSIALLIPLDNSVNAP